MKRAGIVVGLLVMLCGLLVGTGSASAAPTALCHDGIGVRHSANVVANPPGTAVVGQIELCRRGNGWYAEYTHAGTMPSGQLGNAWLWIYRNGTFDRALSCRDDDIDWVEPGQTWCRTPIVQASSGLSFKGRGLWHYSVGGEYHQGAEGFTLRCSTGGCV